MDKLEKLEKIIQTHEDRISKLEKQVTINPTKLKSEKTNEKSDYSGTSGGIQMLIDNGFLNKPKSSKETHDEMQREGFYKSIKNVDGTLRNVFVKKKALSGFRNNSGNRILLLSSKHAASGLDLIEASKIVFIDPVYAEHDVKESIEKQAIGRIDRFL